MPSMDIVSQIDAHEYENAMTQSKKEITTRYDFKGGKCYIEWDPESITVTAENEERLKVVREVVYTKLSKRGISLSSLDTTGKVEPASGMTVRQKIAVKKGIQDEDSRRIMKSIKEAPLKKIQAQRQGDQIRVTGPKIDDLQALMQWLKTHVTDVSLQYENFKR